MGPMRKWSKRSSVMARHTKPRPYFAMKLIASGVTFSAARVKSPSFSRSSSSTTTTILPTRMSSRASGMLLKGKEPLHVLRDHVDLDVDRVAWANPAQRRVLQCIRDQGDGETARAQARHGE